MASTSRVLEITPDKEILFKGNHSDEISVKLTLQSYLSQRINFRVRTTAAKRFKVEPDSGMLKPNDSTFVTVTMLPYSRVPTTRKHPHSCYVEWVDTLQGDKQALPWRQANKKSIPIKFESSDVTPSEASGPSGSQGSDNRLDVLEKTVQSMETFLSGMFPHYQRQSTSDQPAVTERSKSSTEGDTPLALDDAIEEFKKFMLFFNASHESLKAAESNILEQFGLQGENYLEEILIESQFTQGCLDDIVTRGNKAVKQLQQSVKLAEEEK